MKKTLKHKLKDEISICDFCRKDLMPRKKEERFYDDGYPRHWGFYIHIKPWAYTHTKIKEKQLELCEDCVSRILKEFNIK